MLRQPLNPDMRVHEAFMAMALREARAAADRGEVPVGAVIVSGDRVIGRGHNLTQTLCDVTAHAEMQAITAAANWLGGKYLPDCVLYVTVEPCIMCAGALGWSQIGAIVYGAPDPKRGYRSHYGAVPGARSPLHPRTLVMGGVLEQECAALMQQFFKQRR